MKSKQSTPFLPIVTESEYGQTLDLIREEVDIAITSFYTEMEMNDLAVRDRTIFNKLNRNAGFWGIQRYSLQTTFFMAFGRIFDESGDALSIHNLLTATLEPKHFSKSALRARKTRPDESQPDLIDSFLEDIWEPNLSDLRALNLQRALVPHNKHFKAVYRPIRHKVFGHKISTKKEMTELFQKTEKKKIADILYFLHDLTEQLWHLFWNGKKPELGSKAIYEYEETARQNVRDVLLKQA